MQFALPQPDRLILTTFDRSVSQLVLRSLLSLFSIILSQIASRQARSPPENVDSKSLPNEEDQQPNLAVESYARNAQISDLRSQFKVVDLWSGCISVLARLTVRRRRAPGLRSNASAYLRCGEPWQDQNHNFGYSAVC